MTLDEAVLHCEQKSCGNTQCNQEHKQLAEWLKELQLLKKEKAKATSAVCEDCGDWFAVEKEAFNDVRAEKIKCPICQSDNIRKLGIIIYR